MLDLESFIVPSNASGGAVAPLPSFGEMGVDDIFQPFDMMGGDGLEPESAFGMDSASESSELLSQNLLRETEQQAEHILMEARMEAAQILNEAQQKVTLLEENAYAQGFQAGEMAGQQSLQAALDQSQSILKAALEKRQEIIHESEPQVLQLVLNIAKKVIKTEMLLNEQIIINVVNDALQRVGEQTRVTIHVHPSEVEMLKLVLSKEPLIEIEEDESITPGGCILKSKSGNIDAQLETQFDTIAKSLLEMVEPLP